MTQVHYIARVIARVRWWALGHGPRKMTKFSVISGIPRHLAWGAIFDTR